MTAQDLIEQGNQLRAAHDPRAALTCYAQAFLAEPDMASAWNNYGNVLRECGEPARSVPFLQHAILLDPTSVTARFNLAVSWLAMGDYARGWPQYEQRWDYEHLAGTLPVYTQPRWRGEDLRDRTILVLGEQGHGDNIQFVRFLYNLHVMGARVKFATTDGLIPLLGNGGVITQCLRYTDDPGEFDCWTPLMSIPGILGITVQNLPPVINYITATDQDMTIWQQRLGPKTRMRIGFAWSGRRDAWLNEHKGMPFEHMLDLIRTNPQHDWINLQVDVSAGQEAELAQLGVKAFPGSVQHFGHSAGLIMHCDVVVTVDTAVAHLAASLGRPTWLMLNWFAACWRWGVAREDSPWYSTMRIFRQPAQDDWPAVTKRISQYLSWFKV